MADEQEFYTVTYGITGMKRKILLILHERQRKESL